MLSRRSLTINRTRRCLHKSRSVQIAATTPLLRPLPKRAAASIALVCQMENLALGPTYWGAARPGVPYCGAGGVVVQSARSLLITAHSSARGVSVRRMKSMGMCRPADGSTPYLVLKSTGDKGPSTAVMVATEHRVWPKASHQGSRCGSRISRRNSRERHSWSKDLPSRRLLKHNGHDREDS